MTVTLLRPDGDEALPPSGDQAAAELAAAAIAAEGLLTAWARMQSVVSMIVELPSMAGPFGPEWRWRECSGAATG